jgi:hypothetical protein
MVEEVGCQACERLSSGERVHGGSESSWKGSCSFHRDQRILVRPIVEAQGKGGLVAEGLSCVTVKVYTSRVGQACGE